MMEKLVKYKRRDNILRREFSIKIIINSDKYAPPMNLKKKSPLLLLGRKGEKYIITPGQGMKEIGGLGVADTDRLLGTRNGDIVNIAGKEFIAMEAALTDLVECLKRGAQIIMPKDSAQIVMGCSIGPGNHVLEVGTGSGALTIVLAHFVGEGGKVVSYESNPKHAKLARNNISIAGMCNIVEMRETDAANCHDIDAFDAVVMDMPEPWQILDNMTKALKVGGCICAYLPTMNQVEATVRAMREKGYTETHVQENLQRELVVGEGGTRPSFEMLGHTGYLCFGRKVRG
jgi:tRNA (adenine57-N1/adenine58-N1)-methyltransferase